MCSQLNAHRAVWFEYRRFFEANSIWRSLSLSCIWTLASLHAMSTNIPILCSHCSLCFDSVFACITFSASASSLGSRYFHVTWYWLRLLSVAFFVCSVLWFIVESQNQLFGFNYNYKNSTGEATEHMPTCFLRFSEFWIHSMLYFDFVKTVRSHAYLSASNPSQYSSIIEYHSYHQFLRTILFCVRLLNTQFWFESNRNGNSLILTNIGIYVMRIRCILKIGIQHFGSLLLHTLRLTPRETDVLLVVLYRMVWYHWPYTDLQNYRLSVNSVWHLATLHRTSIHFFQTNAHTFFWSF